MISVALCTYNGEKFIEEQIQSILQQTKAVDEIVVCDDGSKDETLEIVRNIAEKSDAQIRIYTNEKPLGVKKNFRKAIELCNGDYVFLSDQDDIWMPHKVETIIKWFEKHPDMSAVFTDAYLVDDQGQPYAGRTQFQGVGFRQLQQEMFNNGHGLEVFMMANRATGATMAFLRNKIELREEDWGEILHDEYIAVKALLNNKLGVIVEPLIKYRQHAGQQIGSSVSDDEIYAVYKDWNFFDPSKSILQIYSWKFTSTYRLGQLITMLKKREEMRLSPVGIIDELRSISGYKQCYGRYWKMYLRSDIRKTIGTIWHKVLKK